MPSLQLKEKVRQGSWLQKRYHPARTPYQRVLEGGSISGANKARLRRVQRSLNPAQLHRQILALQQRLEQLAVRRPSPRVVDGDAPDGKEKAFSPGAWKTPVDTGHKVGRFHR